MAWFDTTVGVVLAGVLAGCGGNGAGVSAGDDGGSTTVDGPSTDDAATPDDTESDDDVSDDAADDVLDDGDDGSGSSEDTGDGGASLTCGVPNIGAACGLEVVPRSDARCLPYALGCPAAPEEAAATPVYFVSSCVGPGCELVGDAGCPTIGDGFAAVGGASLETDSSMSVRLFFAREPDGSTRVDWEGVEEDLNEGQPIGETQNGSLMLAGPCCHTELDVHFPHANQDIHVVIESDWLEVACDPPPADSISYAPCYPVPDVTPQPCGEDAICLFAIPSGSNGGHHFGWNVCSGACASDDDCPAGPDGAAAVCREVFPGMPACVIDCAGGQACPEGMMCQDDGVCAYWHECEGYECTTLS